MTELSWIAIIIAALSAAGVTGSFLLSWHESKRLADQKITEMTIKYNNELTNLSSEVILSKTIVEFNISVSRYINKLDELASLNVRGFISDEVSDFFYYFLKDGHDAIEWLKKNDKNFPYDEGVSDLMNWYKNHKKKSEIKIPVTVIEVYKNIMRKSGSTK